MNILLPLLLVTGSLFAQDFTFDKEKGQAIPTYVGQLRLVRGSVYKKVKGELQAVKIGTRFSKSDTLVTEEKSFARIQVVDDTVITLGQNSELNFEEFKFTDKTNRQAVFNFIKGQLTGHVRNKAKEGDIQVRTKTAVMGIRGTQILVNHQTVKAREISEFALLSGSADVTDPQGSRSALAKADRLVVVTNPTTQASGSEKQKLSEALLKELEAEGLNEEKEFRPFMPYFDVKSLEKNSSLHALLVDQADAKAEPSATPDSKPTDKKHWKENLDKLNEHLKENQKKSR